MNTTPTLAGLEAALPALATEARVRATEFEAARRLAPDFALKLKRAGAFKVLVPVEAGGLGATLPQWFEFMMALAEADASTGWVTGHANITAGLIHASAEPRFGTEFFADPLAFAAWSNLPKVNVKEEEKGLRITGSWSFESGCTEATFVGGMVMLPPLAEGKPPRMVAALAPIAEATIVDLWDPIGLAGTGSHDVRFDDVFVPWHRTFPWPAGISVAKYPAGIFAPGTWFISTGTAATHLGLARRALDEARALMKGKVDRFTGKPVLEHPSTLRSLEAAEGLWFACRAGVREALSAIWRSAERGEPASAEMRLDVRVATATAVQKGAEIVRTAYDASGAIAIHRSGVIQRLLRDASCLTHHASANQAAYELTGRVRCGIDKLSFRI